ncbi:hypothetical protein KFU94_23830 [Chloroflexi bacterium TSY]|nr:hypothetical protein [Chloroflexi bacterium TSY]
MNDKQRPVVNHSQLFTIRLWLEPLGNEHFEMRGKVQHVLSGEARYFRDWDSLADFLTRQMQKDER